jgi:hypothetical protein
MKRPLAVVAILCLVVLAGLVLWAGLGSILTMDESSKSQGGQYYVGAAILAAAVWLIGQFSKISKHL